MNAPPAVNLRGVVHRFGRGYVLRGLSLSVQSGEVLALHGANGAGKTTLLRVLGTALSPTRGEGEILGFDLRDRLPIRAGSMLVSHALGLYPELTGEENLNFSSQMYGLSGARGAALSALERVGLAGVKPRVRAYSSGMRKRLALARALLIRPALLLLDEPFAALDPPGRELTLGLLAEWRDAGSTLIFSTHEPELAARVATRHVTLGGGLLTELGGGLPGEGT